MSDYTRLNMNGYTSLYEMEEDYLLSQRRVRQSMTTHARDVPLELNPHYSDHRFDGHEPLTVFGQEIKGLFYNYSDRLFQADWRKDREAAFAANESGKVRNSAEWLEVYLTYYHGQPVCLYHVLAGVNRSNGYGYAVYGYKYGESVRSEVRMKEREIRRIKEVNHG